MFDYQTLKLIWWVLVGVLLIGFALTDGFDLGAMALLPIVGRTDSERRVVINAIAPHWDGNQVWLITAGAGLFAAWPLVYGAAFSGFYWALLLVLFALFVRPVGFDYRSKLSNPRWRQGWDWALFVGALVPSLVFGVAFGNLLLGVPFHYDDTMRVEYTGGFFELLNPFGLLAGVLSVAMLLTHGATFIMVKTEAAIAARARKIALWGALATLALFVAAGFWVAQGIDGYSITDMPSANSAFMPLTKTVEIVSGAWMDNYNRWPATKAIPVAAIAGLLLVLIFGAWRKARLAFISSGIAVAGIILTAATAMFPFIMPSSLDPRSSLTIWDSVSSHKTLGIMFWLVLFFVPLIMMYTAWVYRVMRGKVTLKHIADNEHTAY